VSSAGQPSSAQMPLAGAVIQQQHPPQSMKPFPQGLGPHAHAVAAPALPPLVVAPAVPPLVVAPALPPPAVAPAVPPLAVAPAPLVVAPALPPEPVLPLSELHAARPTVEDAPVTTRT
jgi:hypothetical protein